MDTEHDRDQFFHAGFTVFCEVCKENSMHYCKDDTGWHWTCDGCGSVCDSDSLLVAMSEELEFLHRSRDDH